MIESAIFKGQTVGVFGLARSGIAAALSLSAGGASVLCFDDAEKGRAAAQAAGLTVADWREWPWARVAALILSPGVPLTHPTPHAIVARAQEAGAEVIGDVEILYRTLKAQARPHKNGNGNGNGSGPSAAANPLICITGTNGKSTTTALIGHLLARAGLRAEVGGNIGRAALDLAPPAPGLVYVIETSSYQIDLSPTLKPEIAILSNVTSDHIDRHGSMEGYVAVKRKLFQHQGAGDVAVVGVDDAPSADTCTLLGAKGGVKAVPVSVGKALGRGVYVIDGVLYDATVSPAVAVANLREAPALQGAHNWQNAALAYAAVRELSRDTQELGRALLAFPGLAHRMERVGKIGKALFVNDSKATNADAAEKALVCFDGIFWIAGGKAKEGGIEPLAPHFPRIAKAYLIGDAAESFARTLEGRVPYERCCDMKTATAMALADALRSAAIEPVILLSPACASFDQFRDFEDRGDQFKAFFARLKSELGEGRAA